MCTCFQVHDVDQMGDRGARDYVFTALRQAFRDHARKGSAQLGLIEIVLAFWVAGNFRKEAILLVIYVGVIALMRGISEIFVAFKLKGLRRGLAATT